jgi:hypothetical protein
MATLLETGQVLAMAMETLLGMVTLLVMTTPLETITVKHCFCRLETRKQGADINIVAKLTPDCLSDQ